MAGVCTFGGNDYERRDDGLQRVQGEVRHYLALCHGAVQELVRSTHEEPDVPGLLPAYRGQLRHTRSVMSGAGPQTLAAPASGSVARAKARSPTARMAL